MTDYALIMVSVSLIASLLTNVIFYREIKNNKRLYVPPAILYRICGKLANALKETQNQSKGVPNVKG